METGKVESAPDYKSKEPRLPKDWGTVKALCANGQHRYLPDAPKCGCGETVNAAVERSRLEREVIEAAKKWRPTQLAKDDPRQSLNPLAAAVDALIDFESKQEK